MTTLLERTEVAVSSIETSAQAQSDVISKGIGVSVGTPAGNIRTLSDAIFTISQANPRGAWATSTIYNLKDLAVEAGIIYIVTDPHTSGVFLTDLGNGKWAVFQNFETFQTGITADASQTQAGGTALTAENNEVVNIVNDDDSVRMFPAFVRAKLRITNKNTTKRLRFFPDVGNNIGNGLVAPNNFGILLPGDTASYISYDGINWVLLEGFIMTSIQIGGWDMFTTPSVTIDHKFGSFFIRVSSINVIIIQNLNVGITSLTRSNVSPTTSSLDGFIEDLDPLGITLVRRDPGYFLQSIFNGTVSNRGNITFWYKP